MDSQILVDALERTPANGSVTRALVVAQSRADRLAQRGQQIEGDVRGLIIVRIGAGYIGAQRSQRRLARPRTRFLAEFQASGEPAGYQSRRDRFYVALDAGNLAREEDVRPCAQL